MVSPNDVLFNNQGTKKLQKDDYENIIVEEVQTEVKTSTEEAYQCPSCGGYLKFDPSTEYYECQSCFRGVQK